MESESNSHAWQMTTRALIAISLCLSLILSPCCSVGCAQATQDYSSDQESKAIHNQELKQTLSDHDSEKQTVTESKSKTSIDSEAATSPEKSAANKSSNPKSPIELSEGTEQLEPVIQNKVVLASSLPPDRLAALLKRLPELKSEETSKSGEFKIPSEPVPSKPEKIVHLEFPPKEASTAPIPKKTLPPFMVLRKSPEGTLSTVPQISVTFSQGMVPLAEAESEILASNVPVHITPQPPGKWRWQGTQTLTFTPDGGHLPRSTNYKLEIPKGTKSVQGGVLANSISWNINAPAAKVDLIYPYNKSEANVDQVFFIRFDQPIEPAKVLPILHMTEGKTSCTLRLASEKEIADDKTIATLSKSKKGSWIAVRSNSLFHRNQQVKLAIGPKIPSSEGPVLQNLSWTSTVVASPPLSVAATENAYSPDATMRIRFNHSLDEKAMKNTMVSIKPTVPNLKVFWQGKWIVLSGKFKANSKYGVTLDKSIPDYSGQTLGTTKTISLSVGPSIPWLILPGSPMAVVQANDNPSFSFLSVNLPQVKVNIYRTNGARDYSKYLKSLGRFQASHDQVQQYKDFEGFGLLSSKVLNLPRAPEEALETAIDLSRYLKEGLGHLVITAEKWPRQKNKIQRFASWVQCTNLGMDAFTDGDTIVTLATKLLDGTPCPGAKVRIEGKVSREGLTDKTGISRIALAATNSQKARTKSPIAEFVSRMPGKGAYDQGLTGLPSIIYCRKGSDEAFLWNGIGTQFAMEESQQQLDNSDTLRWYGVTDRQLYKPGEKVEVKGWIRHLGAGPKGEFEILSSKEIDKIEYKISDANGDDILKGSTRIDSTGGYNFSFQIPKTANLGEALISLSTTKPHPDDYNVPFNIAEFRRPEFELSVKSSTGNTLVLGETASLLAKANYFSGGTLPDAPINWQVKAEDSSFEPPGWSDFSFGKTLDFFSFSEEDYQSSSSEESTESMENSLESKTDANGKHVLDLRVKKMDESTPLSIVAEASVTDLNRQTWTTSATMLLHPADVYVGIRSLKQFYKNDEQINIESVVSDLDGKAVSGRTVQMELSRMTQTWKDNSYKTIEEKLAFSVQPSDSKPAAWNFGIEKGGNMKLVAIVTDAKGRKSRSELSFWKEEKQPEAQLSAKQGKVLVLADRKKYKPGDTAELMIQAPFGASNGVATVRHNGLYSSIPVSFSESAGIVKIPVSEDMMPNSVVQVDLVGADGAYASGSGDLEVSADSCRINIEISPEERALAPGARTKVSIKLTDEKGKALANAQVAVAAVDESILALAKYDWEDPIPVFYSNAFENTANFHTRTYLLLKKKVDKDKLKTKAKLLPGQAIGSQNSYGMGQSEISTVIVPKPAIPSRGGGGSGGGGGGAGEADYTIVGAANMSDSQEGGTGTGEGDPGTGSGFGNIGGLDTIQFPQPEPTPGKPRSKIGMRSDFSALAYFNPSLSTDSNGIVSCEVKVPDNLTRYRIMAVAVAGEKLFGKGESSLTARLPLMVRPSAPRFLNFGDKCELPVVLQNQTEHEMNVDLGLRSSNLRLRPDTAATDPASDPNRLDQAHSSGGSIVVPANDRIEVRFPVSTENDGTASVDFAAASQDLADAASVSLPVYTPATSHAFATYGQIDEGGVAQTVEIPNSVFEQIGGLELSSSSTNLQSLTDAYIYLHDYSFACSEQLSSRILSAVALQDVLSAFGKMTPAEIAATKAQIQADIKEICRRQNQDGSFGLWKRGKADYWPFVSIQVTRALHEAKMRKYEVPQAVLNQARNYLKGIDTYLPKRYFDGPVRRSILAYSLFVRHLMKDSQPDQARKLIQSALALSHDSKNISRNSGSESLVPGEPPLKGLSQQEKLVQMFSLEALSWLLPVISADKTSAAETSMIRAAISASIRESASRAELVVNNEAASYDYHLFSSTSRLNATALEALIMDQPKNDLIPKLAASLLAQRKGNGRWESTQENSASILALSRYFNTYEKQVPDFVANTWLGNQYVGSNKFAGRTSETQQITIPMRFLSKNKEKNKELLIDKTGTGRLYYRLALNYAPKELLLGAYENGFRVTRTYEAIDDPNDVKKDSNGVWHFKAGATIKAKVEFSAPELRSHVALTDPLPAGTEAINISLAGNRTLPAKKKKFDGSDGESTTDDSSTNEEFPGANPWWDFNWYEHHNLRDFRAEAFASSLYSGKYKFTYLMRATTPGEFIVPPTKVEEMYSPETFGRAASEKVIIE